jgi:hypothetical protein
MMVVSRLSSLFANSSPNVLVGYPDSHAGLPSWHCGLALLVRISPSLLSRQSLPWSLVRAVPPDVTV